MDKVTAIEEKDGKLYLIGSVMEFDTPNANGRIYPKGVVVRASEEVQGRIKEERFLGCVDPPWDGKVELDKVAHQVTLLKPEENSLKIVVEVLDTPEGERLRGMVEGAFEAQRNHLGASVRIVSSGVGTVEDGVVQDDYSLMSFGFVAEAEPCSEKPPV
jgi:hypothetical protein